MGSKKLRRYTDLPSLLYMLNKNSITLLDPNSWDDKNDSYFLKLYTERIKSQKTFALCMSMKGETYHHWSVYTSKGNGVCIVFDFKKLKEHLNEQKGVIHKPVKYMKLKKIKDVKTETKKLPFLKRYGFTDESEYRIILSSKKNSDILDIPLPFDAIIRISVNPWMPKPLFETIKSTIHNIGGCENIRVTKSSLVDNNNWKSSKVI
ncbi:DUF2971 domain-containing protein [Pectobacterium brasiliense]|uniref:DUF2971 domain-containing protein n=1 Tax=Pectobacterium brasiliense TaxID=180957 RepID=UPI001CE0E61F|nr:DUF2971 domain-containing protein [Pectobacterium brasiliense]MCA5918514.1 DUF2971 domain-containing protein [Pectobacterium brasiliense]MCA5925947.1 DUF2971 domain-containing protein [Pectobacterium brasiliense]MCA5934378.1 DUF2971 domain-containing protein [Pectobacterium brasiliense]MCA5938560.1 DUF2971 domain-containing protein [Pectobacterium brasiliense]MCA5946490.1 DUF2971 domain-containing protein [Pectobacterium brasiliense]